MFAQKTIQEGLTHTHSYACNSETLCQVGYFCIWGFKSSGIWHWNAGWVVHTVLMALMLPYSETRWKHFDP
jgi:hypothetical protein